MSSRYDRQTDEWVKVEVGELGRGVIAKSFMPRGIALGPIEGRMIMDSNFWSNFAMDLGTGFTLEPDPPFRYLNHSCDPNCELFSWDEDDKPGNLYVGVLRDIAAGEPLTIDYAWPAEEPMRCRCRSANCRGWIVDEALLGELFNDPAPHLGDY